MRSLCSLLLLAAILVPIHAAEVPETHPLLGPQSPEGLDVPVTLMARKGMSVSLKAQAGHSTQASGGVTLTYEAIVIKADSMDFVESAFPGVPKLILDHARLSPGPGGPTPDRISCDSRLTQLPTMGFRGLLTPVSAFIDRQPGEGAHPSQVLYRMLLSQLGDFHGDLHVEDRWLPFSGWADHAVLNLVSDIGAKGVGRKRIDRLILYAASGENGHKAVLRRLRPPSLPGAAHVAGAIDDLGEGEVQSDVITIIYDDKGKLDHIENGDNFVGSGDILPPLHAKP